MENESNIMKKWYGVVSAIKTTQSFFKFMGYVGTITFFGGHNVALAESQNSYPCVTAQSCETGECEPNINQITVDYIDDLGNPYRWTHKVHSTEGLTDCEFAINKHFPYKYGACEES
jgi:hypothetical protein